MQTALDLRGRKSAQARNARQQAEALDRLYALLEGSEVHTVRLEVRTGEGDVEALSRLARLRAARAAYALANGNRMERVSAGAWIRRQKAH